LNPLPAIAFIEEQGNHGVSITELFLPCVPDNPGSTSLRTIPQALETNALQAAALQAPSREMARAAAARTLVLFVVLWSIAVLILALG
jgi:hypothetical protein